MEKTLKKAYQAVLATEEGHFLLGGVTSSVSWPFETAQLAQDALDASVSINAGCHIPITKAYVRSCFTSRKIITEREVYGPSIDSPPKTP